ncbi:hypothetical protein FIBSPDRAFT_518278 [Athelia psychrophila]|uniref:Cytochrome b-c1 complex subunit 8 n=1 Tax=Athelia psychrophila TaxID=1759441 RepID=A0A166V7M4_9AGAM|nr:hypothetical protein FIBSPDRAFT_518278 [Fibularhizoctonia sp. CBS 109695]
MRSSSVRKSEMPGGKTFISWWGDISDNRRKSRGVITYSQSPFRQNPMTGALRGYLFNGTRRLASQLPYWIVPVAIGYGTYTWAKSRDEWQNSKAGHLTLHPPGSDSHH